MCGSKKDAEWQHLYRLNLSYIGKLIVCGSCSNKGICKWAERDDGKAKSRLILQSQDHLFKNIGSITNNSLVILDELKFLELPIQQRAERGELEKFHKQLLNFSQLHNLKYLTECLLLEEKPDIDNLREPKNKDEKQLIKSQTFKFLIRLSNENIHNFSSLALDQLRAKPFFRDQAIYYNVHPDINGPLLVTGFGADKRLLEHYFKRPFEDLTPTEKYTDSGTVFYQLATASTSFYNFMKNKRARDGILRFVAAKIETNRQLKKKTLLVAKKATVATVLKELPSFLRGKAAFQVVPFSGSRDFQSDGIDRIPLIHYGVEGINYFEDYDSVICITAYNLKPSVIESQLKQLGAGRDISVDIKNNPSGIGRFVVSDPHLPLAESVFAYLELHRIIQTISRARPFTTPTEVILAGHQEFDGAIVFTDIRGLTAALNVGAKSERLAGIIKLSQNGLSQKQIAAELGISLRTVSRYLNRLKERRKNEET